MNRFFHKKKDFSRRFRLGEYSIQVVLFFFASISILTTAGIIYILLSQSILFFQSKEVTIFKFLTSLSWQPMASQFGILPLLSATLMTSTIAILISTPISLLVSIYLSEYASQKIRTIIKPFLEILAGIPSVVYGYFAVGFVTPILQASLGSDTVEFYNTASAGIVIGILILPIMITMIDDALNSVPQDLREASYSIGAHKLSTTLGIVVPAAFSGIAASFIIAFSRAVGETMIVALAAGAGPKLTLNPFKGAETMTGYVVRISGGDVSYNSIDYTSIFAIGLILFLITLVLNVISRRIVQKFGSRSS